MSSFSTFGFFLQYNYTEEYTVHGGTAGLTRRGMDKIKHIIILKKVHIVPYRYKHVIFTCELFRSHFFYIMLQRPQYDNRYHTRHTQLTSDDDDMCRESGFSGVETHEKNHSFLPKYRIQLY
jgi:hypothetical protein